MRQIQRDLTTLDSMVHRRVWLRSYFQCFFSFDSTSVCFCVTLLHHATENDYTN